MSSTIPPAPPQGPPGGWGQGPAGHPGFGPGPTKRPWFKKKRYIIPLALVALIALASLFSGGNTDTTTSTTAEPSATDPTSAPEAPAAPAPPPAPDYPGKLKGDKVASGPGAEIQLSGWTVSASQLERTRSPFGTDNLCSTVSMTNRDGKQQEYNGLSWKMQTPNGNVQDMTFTGDNDLSSGGLAPGGNVTKTVCFADEGAGSGTYILSWQPDIFSSKNRGVWLNQL